MHTHRFAAMRVAIALLLVAAVASTTASAASAPLADDPAVREALARLDVWLDGQRRRLDLPGFAIGVVHDQQLVWSKGYGYADVAQRIPSTDRTLYRIASISKTFTATAVVQLAESGKLSLQDPVVRHLPWFAPAPAAGADGDKAPPVRVWNLLSHTSGLQREPPGSDWDALQAPSLEEVVTATPVTALSLEPATRLKYSNYGYLVAGQLVERISGQPYARYLRENVLRPLGLADTDFLDSDATRTGLAVPYGRRGVEGEPRAVVDQLERSDPFLPVGGLVSSVQDLAKWASFQFRDSGNQQGPVLSGAALREMHRPHLLLADWSQGWGLGWRLTRYETGARIDHGGSLPGYMSSLMMDPASRVAVILLFNSDDGPRQLSKNILDLVAPPLQAAARSRAAAGQGATASTAAPAAAELARFEGRYRDRSGELVYVLVGADGRLQLLSPEADDIAASALPLRQTGPTRFVTQAPAKALTWGVESVVEFTVDGSGRATGFKVENGAYGFRRVD